MDVVRPFRAEERFCEETVFRVCRLLLVSRLGSQNDRIPNDAIPGRVVPIAFLDFFFTRLQPNFGDVARRSRAANEQPHDGFTAVRVLSPKLP